MQPTEIVNALAASVGRRLARYSFILSSASPFNVPAKQIGYDLRDQDGKSALESITTERIDNIAAAIVKQVPKHAKACHHLHLPRGVEAAHEGKDVEHGIIIRLVVAYDFLQGDFISRFDLLVS